MMDECKKIQNMIVSFELGTLSMHDEERFINHVSKCKDCKEEVEIYYIITYGLEEDDKTVKLDEKYRKMLDLYDFTGLVEAKLKNSFAKIEAIKKHERFFRILLFLCNVCMILTFLIYIIIKYY